MARETQSLETTQRPKTAQESTNDAKKPAGDLVMEGEVIAAKVQPSTDEEQWRTDQRRYWKRQLRIAKWLNWITVGAVIGGFISLFFVWKTLDATRAAAGAAATQAQVALDQLHSQRPYVSLGRADGVIAEYIPPVEGIEILDSRLVPTANDWKLVEANMWEHEFSLDGNLEYCDPWGSYHCERFLVRYKPAPIRRFVSELTSVCRDGYPRHLDPSELARGPEYRVEILSRCEQPEERISREKRAQ